MFGVVHALVINLRETVEFLSDSVEIFSFLVIFESADSFGTKIHRVKRENGIRLIGIRVHPGSGHGGVVDGKNLQHLLTGLHAPVHHFLDIKEISDTEIIFSPYSEHGDSRAGTFPLFFRIGKAGAVDYYLLGLDFADHSENAVVHRLPTFHFAVARQNKEFIFETLRNRVEREVHFPYREPGVVHPDGPGGIPVAEISSFASYRENLIRLNHRSLYPDVERGRQRGQWCILMSAASEHSLGECRGVKRFVGRDVAPGVENRTEFDSPT